MGLLAHQNYRLRFQWLSHVISTASLSCDGTSIPTSIPRTYKSVCKLEPKLTTHSFSRALKCFWLTGSVVTTPVCRNAFDPQNLASYPNLDPLLWLVDSAPPRHVVLDQATPEYCGLECQVFSWVTTLYRSNCPQNLSYIGLRLC